MTITIYVMSAVLVFVFSGILSMAEPGAADRRQKVSGLVQ
jgi:uncharacterized protein YjeT (DUF2065 family)